MPDTATVQIAMPEMGESVTEGIVLEWHVAVGDFVNEGDTVVEVSTDKVDAEVPAPTSGVITKLLVSPDDTVQIGQALAEMTAGAAPADSAPAAVEGPAAAPAPPATDGGDGRRASPVARRAAAANGVDLGAVQGSGPGGNRGDIGVTLFADARVTKHFNLSGNVGYSWNGDVKGEFPNGKFTLLDRPDELMGSVGVDFPINRFFQPIFELRALRYVAGHTPNAFPQNPIDGIAGFRIYPARWLSIGAAYRYNFNEQDTGYFDEDKTFSTSVAVVCGGVSTAGSNTPAGSQVCTTRLVPGSFKGVPPGFNPSEDPHGFIVQFTAGRRNKRQDEIPNKPADVNSLTLSQSQINLPCQPGFKSASGGCNDSTTINVTTAAADPENDVLTYNYTVSGGRIVGQGANVQWDLSGARAGTYTITAGVDDGCGICGKTQTQTVAIKDCPDCVKVCDCPSISVDGPSGITPPGGTMTFTAALNGGSQDGLTYNWTVTDGTIASGQGTPSITVTAPTSEAGGNITATVEIGGYPAGCDCPKGGSATGPYGGKPDMNNRSRSRRS